ncbi:DUF2958 domain-containing protein [Acidocella sp.]|jgi:hypothetical protein|uniref:DUF2958 domain-containing protein n=1 Tax=Acidocella sp. TaxID=50710 RepID=UPI00262BC1CA|nr:DUF2958 domain-containing protein [Acidocella sp.]MDD2794640.1 DUF2958 domain-containing protein [Acidocella sp.]
MSEDREPTAAMRLFTPEQRAALIENGRRSREGHEIDPFPVVKLFLPGSDMTWLLTELDPEDDDLAFGLGDLGMGCPELGYVSLGEITSVKTALGLTVERDQFFQADKALSAYATAAQRAGYIVA